MVAAGTPIIRLSSPDADKVVFSLDADRLPLSIGSELLIREESVSYTGSVRSISPIRDMKTDRHTVEVSVPQDIAKSGNRAWIIPSQKGESGIVIPLSAMVTKYSIPSVFVIQADGTVRLTPIRIVDSDTEHARVDGIQSGTSVVTEGKDALLDGEMVEIRR